MNVSDSEVAWSILKDEGFSRTKEAHDVRKLASRGQALFPDLPDTPRGEKGLATRGYKKVISSDHDQNKIFYRRM